jgi:hypothetical protein
MKGNDPQENNNPRGLEFDTSHNLFVAEIIQTRNAVRGLKREPLGTKNSPRPSRRAKMRRAD